MSLQEKEHHNSLLNRYLISKGEFFLNLDEFGVHLFRAPYRGTTFELWLPSSSEPNVYAMAGNHNTHVDFERPYLKIPPSVITVIRPRCRCRSHINLLDYFLEKVHGLDDDLRQVLTATRNPWSDSINNSSSMRSTRKSNSEDASMPIRHVLCLNSEIPTNSSSKSSVEIHEDEFKPSSKRKLVSSTRPRNQDFKRKRVQPTTQDNQDDMTNRKESNARITTNHLSTSDSLKKSNKLKNSIEFESSSDEESGSDTTIEEKEEDENDSLSTSPEYGSLAEDSISSGTQSLESSNRRSSIRRNQRNRTKNTRYLIDKSLDLDMNELISMKRKNIKLIKSRYWGVCAEKNRFRGFYEIQ